VLVRTLRAALVACPRPVLVASAAAWLALALGAHGIAFASYCGALGGVALDSWPRLIAAMTLTAPSVAAAQWLLMLAAMMLPLLTGELRHVHARTLARHRPRSTGLFLAAYAAVWLAACPVLIGAALLLRLAAGTAPAASAMALCVALAWQCTPAKQACLNRCHRRPRLAAFGAGACLDCVRYGMWTGLSCCGSCWALMLATLGLDAYHFPLMLLGAAAILAERQAPARAPAWLPLRGRNPLRALAR
jgi:predicted metal-binding membrane protein